ncbi:MAG: hypothetical protein GY811_05615 [Myxococcales bacterium]|nr:hypothetical protein [Myxococcales bacterium]
MVPPLGGPQLGESKVLFQRRSSQQHEVFGSKGKCFFEYSPNRCSEANVLKPTVDLDDL